MNKILIVDASDSDRRLMSGLLTRAGYEPIVAYQVADLYNVASNWLVGRRIVEQEQHGEARAQYGKHVIESAKWKRTRTRKLSRK